MIHAESDFTQYHFRQKLSDSIFLLFKADPLKELTPTEIANKLGSKILSVRPQCTLLDKTGYIKRLETKGVTAMGRADKRYRLTEKGLKQETPPKVSFTMVYGKGKKKRCDDSLWDE